MQKIFSLLTLNYSFSSQNLFVLPIFIIGKILFFHQQFPVSAKFRFLETACLPFLLAERWGAFVSVPLFFTCNKQQKLLFKIILFRLQDRFANFGEVPFYWNEHGNKYKEFKMNLLMSFSGFV